MNIQKEAPRSGEANQSKSKTDSTVKIDKRKISKLTRAIMSANNCSRGTADGKIKVSAAVLGFKPIIGKGYTPEQRKAILDYIRNPMAPRELDTSLIPITADASFEEIEQAGLTHRGMAENHAIAFCHCVAALKEKCASISGGSDFSAKAKEFWDISSSQAHRLMKIGQSTSFPESGKALPQTISTLEVLAQLPHDDLKAAVETGKINPKTTKKDAEKVVESFNSKVDKGKKKEEVKAFTPKTDEIVDGELIDGVEANSESPDKPQAADAATDGTMKTEDRQELIDEFNGALGLASDHNRDLKKQLDRVEKLVVENPALFGEASQKCYADIWTMMDAALDFDEAVAGNNFGGCVVTQEEG